MRNRHLGLTLALLLVLVLGPLAVAGTAAAGKNSPDAWTQDPVPSPFAFWRVSSVYVPSLAKVYFLGGRLADGSTDGSIWMFDPATDTYSQPAGSPVLPVPVSNHVIVALNDGLGHGIGIYSFGGRNSAGVPDTAVQVYYPQDNTVQQIATDPWPGTTTAMGCPQFPGSVEAYNNKAYAFGGYGLQGPCGTTYDTSDQTWIYDPTAAAGSRWSPGPALTLARGYIASAIADGYLYAMGGDTTDGTTLYASPRAERMLLPSGTWQQIADIPTPSSGIAGCDENRAFGFNTGSGNALAGNVVLIGCGQWPSELADSFKYDIAAGTWSSWDSLLNVRRNFAAALEVQPSLVRMWVFGGRQGTDSNILTATESNSVTVTPTAVQLTGIEGHSLPANATPFAMAGLALLALLGLAGLRVLHPARR